jgi:c-di-GMP-binding flagellar brake protein YcgR
MGIEINRIEKEFIFKRALDSKIRANIHGDKKELEGALVDFSENSISVETITENNLEVGEEVRVYLFFQNNMHTFNSTVKEVEPNKIVITQPAGVYKQLQRKHERVKTPENVSGFFTLKGKNFELNFPKMSRYFTVERPESAESFDESSIEDLISDFRSKVNKMVSNNNIVMLRNRNPSSFEERLMFNTAKIIWVPSIKEGYAPHDPFPDNRILTKREMIQQEGESEFSDSVLNARLENRLDEKFRDHIYSEIYCPLMYNQYFVGYVHVFNTLTKKESISEAIIEYVYQFAKVLCYSLEINGYFTSLANQEKDFETQIIDLSASGLLFANPAKDLSRDLLIHTDLKVTLKFKGRSMQIGARIIRKFKDRDHLYIGLQFMDIAPEDFRLLFESIYGKSFNDEFNNQWEGGIPPPKLKFD